MGDARIALPPGLTFVQVFYKSKSPPQAVWHHKDQLQACGDARAQAAFHAAAELCDAKFIARAAGGFPREASTARALADEIRTLAAQK